MYAVPLHQCQPAEVKWQDSNLNVVADLPREVRRWLLDSGSLTAHLRRESTGHFHVEVLSQHWGLPQPSERRLLGMADREWGLLRQVLLCCHGEPWVFARSVMPARSLVGRLHRLRRLDNTPLGQLLFSDPSMRRKPYEVTSFPAAALPMEGLADVDDSLHGRRSCFYLDSRPIMVSEIFLPSFRPWS